MLHDSTFSHFKPDPGTRSHWQLVNALCSCKMTISAAVLFPGSLHRLQVAQDRLAGPAGLAGAAALPPPRPRLWNRSLWPWPCSVATTHTEDTAPGPVEDRRAKGLSRSEAGLLC